MEIRRTNYPKKNPLRRELERCVIAFNVCLKDVVQSMNIIILLRNCHPSYRADYAYKLLDAKLIKPDDVHEFIKLKRDEPIRIVRKGIKRI